MKGLLIFILVVGVLAYAGNQGFQWYQDQVYSPAGSKSATVPFKVSPGETGNQVGDDLATKGLIRSREAFQFYLKVSGVTPNFQAKSRCGGNLSPRAARLRTNLGAAS